MTDMYRERIKPLFDKSGLMNKDLETEIGIPPKKISDWNAGRLKSYDKYIPQIASYFHVSTDYLLGKTDNPTLIEQEKPPTPVAEDGLDETERCIMECVKRMSPEQKQALLASFQALLEQS